MPGPDHIYVPFSTYEVFNSIVSPSHNLLTPVIKGLLGCGNTEITISSETFEKHPSFSANTLNIPELAAAEVGIM